jgi:hypothetical protein
LWTKKVLAQYSNFFKKLRLKRTKNIIFPPYFRETIPVLPCLASRPCRPSLKFLHSTLQKSPNPALNRPFYEPLLPNYLITFSFSFFVPRCFQPTIAQTPKKRPLIPYPKSLMPNP